MMALRSALLVLLAATNAVAVAADETNETTTLMISDADTVAADETNETTTLMISDADMATSSAAPSVTEQVPVATISFTITVAGVSFDDLVGNPTLAESFKTTCTQTIVVASGITMADIVVTLAAGSVAVNSVITVPSGTSATSLSSSISAGSAAMATTLVSNLEEIPDIQSVVSGTMSATVSEISTTTNGVSTITDDSTISDDSTTSDDDGTEATTTTAQVDSSVDAIADGGIRANALALACVVVPFGAAVFAA